MHIYTCAAHTYTYMCAQHNHTHIHTYTTHSHIHIYDIQTIHTQHTYTHTYTHIHNTHLYKHQSQEWVKETHHEIKCLCKPDKVLEIRTRQSPKPTITGELWRRTAVTGGSQVNGKGAGRTQLWLLRKISNTMSSLGPPRGMDAGASCWHPPLSWAELCKPPPSQVSSDSWLLWLQASPHIFPALSGLLFLRSTPIIIALLTMLCAQGNLLTLCGVPTALHTYVYRLAPGLPSAT